MNWVYSDEAGKRTEAFIGELLTHVCESISTYGGTQVQGDNGSLIARGAFYLVCEWCM